MWPEGTGEPGSAGPYLQLHHLQLGGFPGSAVGTASSSPSDFENTISNMLVHAGYSVSMNLLHLRLPSGRNAREILSLMACSVTIAFLRMLQVVAWMKGDIFRGSVLVHSAE